MHRFVLLSLAVIGLCGCVAHGATSGRVVIRDENVSVDVRFSDQDRAAIGAYYKKAAKGMPPGHAKRGGDLPPGLAKRDQLPPGLAKRDRLPDGIEGEALPRELEQRLSRLPDSYLRVRVGQDFVILDRRTRVVFDIAYGLGN